MHASCTIAPTSKPVVSVRIWRLRPLIFLPASYPHGPPASVVLTDWRSAPAPAKAGDPGGRAGFAAHRFTRQHQEDMVDLSPQAVVAPGIEVVLNRGEGREILGQHPPLAAALGNVEDGVYHRPQRRRAPPPAPCAAVASTPRSPPIRHRIAIGGVACIAQPIPPILRASDFCPHLVPPPPLANTTKSQNAEITHLNFGSASE